MRIISGIKVVAETLGSGATAERGDEVAFDCAGALRNGSVVQDRTREETRLGARRLIPGIEKSLLGMRVGGHRKVRISPHLAYGERGVPGKVPPDAVLDYDLWLVSVKKADQQLPPPP
jgi:FKBP-type peptidyl-prolyl cis-trans isomerase